MPRTLLITIMLLFTTSAARAAEGEPPPTSSHDYLFPGDGRVALRASSGLPYAALAELSVGLGDRFALGALVAGGPFTLGLAFGVDPRLDLVHVGPMRLVLESPVIWYPGIEGNDNWIVVRPMARVEAGAGRLRVHGSAGALYASMVGAVAVRGPIQPYGGNGLPSGVQHGTVWNTVGCGFAVAISPRTSVFAEGFLIMDGFQVAGAEWFALPGAAFLGITTTL